MYVVQVKYLAAYLCNLIEFHSNFERFKFRRLSIWLADKQGRHELLSPCYPVYLGSAVQKGHKSMASINFFPSFFFWTLRCPIYCFSFTRPTMDWMAVREPPPFTTDLSIKWMKKMTMRCRYKKRGNFKSLQVISDTYLVTGCHFLTCLNLTATNSNKSVVIQQISTCFIPFDSPLNTLQFIFWVQRCQTKGSVGNFNKKWRHLVYLKRVRCCPQTADKRIFDNQNKKRATV